MELNEFIKQRRKQLKKTQQDIAAECNISFQSVGKWERGDSQPGADKLPALSRALQVSVSLLVSGKDDGEPPLAGDFDTGRFCAFLASLRTRCKLTQSEVAKQLYVNQSTVAKWESGKLLPDAGMLKDICVLYAVTPTELFSLKADLSSPVVVGSVGNANTARIWRLLKRWKTATAVICCLLVAFIVLSTVMITQNVSLADYKSKYEASVTQNKENVEKYNELVAKYEDVASKYEDLVKETNTVYTLTLSDDFAEEKVITSDVAGNDYFILSSPEKDGYVFKGWNTKQDGSGDYFSTNIKVTSDETLYAIWQPVWLDERVYGESAANINALFLKIEKDFDKLFGYFEFFRSFFSTPYSEFDLYQQFDTAAAIYGCFDTSLTYTDDVYYSEYHPLYICAYLSDAEEIARTIPELSQFADALSKAQTTALELSSNATSGYYYDDTHEWGEEYRNMVYESYFNDYAPLIETICNAMDYNGKESPYEKFVKAYSVSN